MGRDSERTSPRMKAGQQGGTTEREREGTKKKIQAERPIGSSSTEHAKRKGRQAIEKRLERQGRNQHKRVPRRAEKDSTSNTPFTDKRCQRHLSFTRACCSTLALLSPAPNCVCYRWTVRLTWGFSGQGPVDHKVGVRLFKATDAARPGRSFTLGLVIFSFERPNANLMISIGASSTSFSGFQHRGQHYFLEWLLFIPSRAVRHSEPALAMSLFSSAFQCFCTPPLPSPKTSQVKS